MSQPPRVHSKSPEPILSSLSLSMDFRRCSCHKMLENTCVDDAAYLCDYCIPKLLEGHRVESLDEASMKKEELLKELSASKSEAEDRIQGLKKDGQLLQLEADVLSEKVSVVFQDMKKHMEVLEKKVLSEISRQLERTSAPCHDEIQELEAKKDELSRKMATIKELCTTSDPITVLKRLETEDGGGNHQETKAAHELDEGLISEILNSGFAELVTIAYKGLFMNKESNILLDENTAGNNILLLPDMKSFYWVETHKPKPKTPQRFKDHQVLSSSSFSAGRHFWTVETSKWGNWRIGMSYPSIARKGFRSYIGCNNKSWGLCKWNNQYSAMHACKEIKIPNKFTCQAFGVYLDYEAGHLSFYELSDPIRHLYTFNATFTKPLHAVFRLWLDSHGGAWMILKNRGRPVDGTIAEAAKGVETFQFVN